MNAPATFAEAVRDESLFFQPCDRVDCKSSDRGEFFPVLVFTTGYRLTIPEVVCSSCRRTLKATDYLTDGIWDSVVASHATAKDGEPVRLQTRIDFIPVEAQPVSLQTFNAIKLPGRVTTGGGF